MTDEVGVIAGPETENQAVETAEAPPEVVEAKPEVPEVKKPEDGQKRNGFAKKLARKDEVIAELQAKLAQVQPKAEPKVETAPKPDDFETYGDYAAALADHKAKEAVKEALAQRDNQAKQEQLRSERERMAQDFQAKAKEFAKTAPDFYEVTQSVDFELSPAMQQALLESDMGPQLAYHLAQNLDEAEQLNQMGYGQIARRLGKLEATLTSQKVEAKVTKAPPPINPVGGSVKGEFNPYSSRGDDYEAYARWRATQTN